MRICIVYDCLFPWTVGGAERWYRNLAERLAADGHEVTYLTRLQWSPGEPPALPGVQVVPVSRDEPLYGPDGNRRIGQALRFGAGVLRHLARHGGRYDVVHTASFPYFSVLAATLVRPARRFDLVVDWFEVWSRAYWREYLGGVKGTIGHAVQRCCVRVPQRANCFSALHAARLRTEGLRRDPTILRGLYVGPQQAPEPHAAEPLVVFAGRHIAEKRPSSVVSAVARARRALPQLRGVVLGDGPDRPLVLAAIAREGLEGIVEAPGFVDADEVDRRLRTALCLLLPSRREGYGMVVVEAAARGTPSIVVIEDDNAAVELVEDGINGVVAESADADTLAAAIERVDAGGLALRAATCRWFVDNAVALSMESSLIAVAAAYRERSARS